MQFTCRLLQLPPFLLFAYTLAVFTVVAVILTYLFRKFVKIRVKRSHNEAVGFVFAVLGGFYGLLMGFVVFLVWSAADGAQSNASREGSLAKALYRDIRYFPDSVQVKPLRDSYIKYAHHVVEQEYPLLEQMKPLTAASRTDFDDVFRQMEKLDAHEPKIEQMFNNLNELATYRSLRQLDASSEIPIEIWIPLLLGALIIMLFTTMIDVESLRLHLFVSGLLGAFIGLVIYIVVMIDHPFTGKIRIEPTDYENILQMDRDGK